jgi:DNA-directed RNA polymerase subunit M/transcription elongation factor TFIIS
MDNFCKNCKMYLKYKEIEDKLYKYCNKCGDDSKIEITNVCLFTKKYKNIDLDYLENIKVKEKNIINDRTIPVNKSKCKKCKKINYNPYIVKYINNKYNIIYTCIKCEENYKL